MELVLARLLHLLVLVYWLGGDLGAFYASGILSDPRRPPAARVAAGQVLSHVDLAPNTALILTLPSGLSLALAKGWLLFPVVWLAPLWLLALCWVAATWRLHLSAIPRPRLSWLDLLIRWALIASLLVAVAAGLSGATPMPIFIALKLAILAAATGLGLLIRHFLQPFGPAYVALTRGEQTAETDAVIAEALARSRPAVLAIWMLLLCAAALGLAAPEHI